MTAYHPPRLCKKRRASIHNGHSGRPLRHPRSFERDGHGDPVACLKLIAATVPRELVVAREKESNVDMENLSFSEFMGPAERLKRENQFEWL